MIFPLEKVLLKVAGVCTEVQVNNDISFIGKEYNVNKEKVIATLWNVESTLNNYLRLLEDNSYETYEVISNAYIGINTDKSIEEKEDSYFVFLNRNTFHYKIIKGSYESMPLELKEKVKNIPFKDNIYAWYILDNDLILNIIGEPDVR